MVSALRRTCGAGAKYLRRSCPIASDTTKLFMGDVPRRAGWWNVTLGRDASSIEVGGNQECQATPVLKQKPDCSLAMAVGRALKGWIMEPVKGQPDTFTIRSKNPPQGCGKQVYLGVPNDNCKAKKVQMYASDDGTGKQHWLMVPKGKVASPKPKPSKKKPSKKPQQAPGAPGTKAKYHVRVDAKTKGKSCNEWLTKAQVSSNNY
jgi:cell division septation protein DedD